MGNGSDAQPPAALDSSRCTVPIDQLTVATLPYGVVVQDTGGEVLSANRAAEELLGLTLDQLQGRAAADPRWHAICEDGSPFPIDDLPTMRALRTGLAIAGSILGVFNPRSGGYRWLRVTAVPLCRPGESTPVHVYATLEDVTEHRQAQAALAESEAKYRALVEQVPVVTYTAALDTIGSTLYVSPQVESVLGFSPDEWLADPALWVTRLHEDDRERVLAAYAVAVTTTGSFQVEYRFRARDDREVAVRDQAVVVRSASGQPLYMQGVMVDISARMAFERQLTHLAYHDELTGLPNRSAFIESLTRALQEGTDAAPLAVLFMDLDGFKLVNDSLGHAAGDVLLRLLARRLTGAVRPGDTVTRLGGDEFAVLLRGVPDQQAAVHLAGHLLEAVRQPLSVQGRPVFITASIGLALVAPDQHRAGAEEVLRQADITMYQAKLAGKDRVVVFNQAMLTAVQERLDLELGLRRALEHGELDLVYQPELDLVHHRIVGVEALVRWQHPQRGRISPVEFMAVAEATGLIVPIGRWVLTEACRQVACWQQQRPTEPPLALAVNVSARQLAEPDLVEVVAGVLAATGLPPESLWLELTETGLLRDEVVAYQTLSGLKSLGVRLALDDFGTGYSSLSYLRRFPIDMLKVDRSFTAALEHDPGATAIVQAMVTLAHALGMQVTAEGVETLPQLHHLTYLGCDWAQGYHVGRPLPAEDCTTLLASSVLQTA